MEISFVLILGAIEMELEGLQPRLHHWRRYGARIESFEQGGGDRTERDVPQPKNQDFTQQDSRVHMTRPSMTVLDRVTYRSLEEELS
ncbi:Hypothetical predicted protein, partial [Olea europaea subsp. europaea]